MQAPVGSLLMEIAGTELEQFDRFVVTGSATVDGLLTVSLLDGFLPLPTDSFTIFSAANLSGRFDNADLQVTLPEGVFSILYTPTSVTLTNFQAVPEPSALAWIAIAGASLLRRRR